MEKPIDKSKDELTVWMTALVSAFTNAGFRSIYHETTNGCFMGDLNVWSSNTDERGTLSTLYKIRFYNKIVTNIQQPIQTHQAAISVRTCHCFVKVFNPMSASHVNFTNFNVKKVDKIVGYARAYIEKKIANEQANDAKRRRASTARKIWEASGITLPDWITASANTDREEDTGTFHMTFHQNTSRYGLKRLTPEQIRQITQFIEVVIEPPKVTGKNLKYDRKADDKQWLHDTENP